MELNSPECADLSKLLTLKPKRFSEDAFIKLFKEIQKCKWKKNSKEYKKFRSQLEKCCNATQNFIVTQVNTPLGTNLGYDAESKRILKITENIFELIPKKDPLKGHTLKRCSVIGNAGVLTNSSCGVEINQADFVFRCNLPPIKDYKDDVGTKTDIVTANPSIIIKRYQSLNLRRKPFVDYMSAYEDAFILLPAFSYSVNTSPSFKVSYTLQDFGTKQQAIFLNPSYMKTIAKFWKNEGIRELRLSTGFIMLSAALESCEEVWVYGFWPFTKGVHGNQFFHHYYDNVLPNKVHSMSNEFYKLLQLHMKGIVKLHADAYHALQVLLDGVRMRRETLFPTDGRRCPGSATKKAWEEVASEVSNRGKTTRTWIQWRKRFNDLTRSGKSLNGHTE
ncbi:alpha-N-acetylneuraminide alpha-2,8-sialyltransferase-like [Heptranchias perlo]|uniref:alpha-N-acetylneuraminide alpha-2,8-sialyltransferase-like n=1 Tax=Heptranchias perlo TaxID=212740 RepID=UPI00355A8769